MSNSELLEQLLSSHHVVVYNIAEGFFALLPNYIVALVIECLDTDNAFANATRINKRWHQLVEPLWKEFAKSRGYLQLEKLYKDKANLNWKWIVESKTVQLTSPANGLGYVQRDVERFEGEFLDDLPHGWVYTTNSKTRISFFGQFTNGKKSGFGQSKLTSGSFFEGQFQDDLEHGYGVFNYINGNKFEGHYEKGHRHGIGKFTWTEGDSYEGAWDLGRREGFGKYHYSVGDDYEGNWVDDIKHGEGYYKYHYGGNYKGEYFQDRRGGPGVYTWPDGDKYIGMWKDGSRFGEGQLVLTDGTTIDQVWNELPQANYSMTIPSKYPK